MKIKDLAQSIGGLSRPSKMPGFSYGIPAVDCKIGSILRAAGKHTVCGSCYAHKGMYSFSNVKKAQARRLEILSSNLADWTKNMTELIARKYAKKERIFRWHDSGDLQSWEHLSAIVKIAEELSDIRFWLPTKEYALIRKWIHTHGEFPVNLTVRVSAPNIGQTFPSIPGTVSSTVGSGKGFLCPAPTQENECKDCRACWDKSVESVDYSYH